MLVKQIIRRTGDRIDFSRGDDPSNPQCTGKGVCKCSERSQILNTVFFSDA